MAKKFYKNNSKRRLKPTIFLPKNRKGLSTIIVTLMIILLSIIAIGIVWAFVSNMVKEQIKSSESCFGNYDKIQINGQYTCFEKLAPSDYKLRFSLSVGDVTLDKIVVSVASGGEVNSFEITNTPTTFSNLVMYSGANPADVVLPGKNSGKTYNATGFTSKIDSIEIAPYINGNLCEVADSVSEIEDCALFF